VKCLVNSLHGSCRAEHLLQLSMTALEWNVVIHYDLYNILSRPERGGGLIYKETWGLDWRLDLLETPLTILGFYSHGSITNSDSLRSVIALSQLESTVHYNMHLALSVCFPTQVLRYRLQTAHVPFPGFPNKNFISMILRNLTIYPCDKSLFHSESNRSKQGRFSYLPTDRRQTSL
jgi:hypothetical protein